MMRFWKITGLSEVYVDAFPPLGHVGGQVTRSGAYLRHRHQRIEVRAGQGARCDGLPKSQDFRQAHPAGELRPVKSLSRSEVSEEEHLAPRFWSMDRTTILVLASQFQ